MITISSVKMATQNFKEYEKKNQGNITLLNIHDYLIKKFKMTILRKCNVTRKHRKTIQQYQ